MRGAQYGPAELMQWLAALPAKHDCSLECGAGTGELSAFLRPFFETVIATDRSPPPKAQQKTEILTASAERLSITDGSVDLLFSMQALHFFDVTLHVLEAERVLRKGGVFAALSWGEIMLPPNVAAAYAPVFNAVSPFWEDTRTWVLSGYEGLAFPGTAVGIPPTYLTRRMTLADIDAHLATWSAVQNAFSSEVEFPEPARSENGLSEDEAYTVRWRIVGRVYVR